MSLRMRLLALAGPVRPSRAARPTWPTWPACRGALAALSLLAGALVAAPGAAADSLVAPVEVAAVTEVAQPALAPNDLELDLLARVNAARAANGLEALALDTATLGVARARAEDQLPLPKLSHYDASGELAFVRRLADASIDYRMVGENLARLAGSAAAAAERAHAALMDSPSHRANILEPRYTKLAIGAATSPSGQIVFAQIFRDVG